MSWFSRIFTRPTAAVEAKSLDEALLEILGGAPSTAAGLSVGAGNALRVPAVACAVRVISEAVACLPIQVRRGTEVVTDHPAARLLTGDWNAWTSAFDGLLTLTQDGLLHDQGGIAVVVRVDGEAREAIRYTPGSISVRYDELTGEPSYSLNALPLDPSSVVHIRSPLGRSPVSLAREPIALALVMEAHAARLFSNGARPSGLLSLKANPNQDVIAKIRAAWQLAHGGDKSGGTAIVGGDAHYEQLTLNSVDAQFLEMRQFQILEIARAFRVPPHMLYDLNRATWANAAQLGQEFLVFCLQPWLKAWESALSRALLSAEERATGFIIKFETDDLTQADIGQRAVAYSSLIASRVINPNEARAWENLPPYEGGDEFANPNITTGAPQLRAAA